MSMWQQHGYNDISINQICKSCGVTKGSFYHHFLNKESVILEYYNQCLDEAQLDVDEDGSFISQIFELLKISTVPLMDLNADIITAFLNSSRINETLNCRNDSFSDTAVYEHMVSCCRKGQQCGEIRDSHPAETLIDTVLIAMTGNFYLWVAEQKSFDLFEKDGRAEFVIDYRRDMYSADFIRAFAGCFEKAAQIPSESFNMFFPL